jgi:hypothetical protein
MGQRQPNFGSSAPSPSAPHLVRALSAGAVLVQRHRNASDEGWLLCDSVNAAWEFLEHAASCLRLNDCQKKCF